MAQTQHTGDGEGTGGRNTGQPGDDRTREQPRPAAAGGSGPQDAVSHVGRDAADESGDAHTPAAGHLTGAAGRSFHGSPGTPGQGVEGDFGTVGEGRYRLVRRLGRGGMAEVFAAQDVRLGRTVAVKLLRTELAQDDVARLRFTREAHSVASLNHHAVVAVYDTGEEELTGGDSMPYIVMELVEGRTVRELLVDEDAPPVDQALIIIAGVLEALAYSHRHGIVHRDIKPANVIITTGGAVKVMDFGIARALTGAASTMTQTGMVMGTPQYLSPEQALGKAVDHRSDLYATGCMLYELLALRPPFTGDTPLSVVYQHVQDHPVPPSQANTRVAPPMDGLVLRSLAKEPDDRYQTADEFRAHVQQMLREIHGGGSGYAAGAAAAAAATAGLAAAGSGGGAYPSLKSGSGTPPTGSYAATEQFNASTSPMGNAHTAANPGYPSYGTPPEGYGAGTGGPAGPGGGNGQSGRRRAALIWLAVAAAIVVAAVLGIVSARPDHPGGAAPGETAPSRSATTSETDNQPVVPDPSVADPTETDDGAGAGSDDTGSGGGEPNRPPVLKPTPTAPATDSVSPSTQPTKSPEPPTPSATTGAPSEPPVTPSTPPDTPGGGETTGGGSSGGTGGPGSPAGGPTGGASGAPEDDAG